MLTKLEKKHTKTHQGIPGLNWGESEHKRRISFWESTMLIKKKNNKKKYSFNVVSLRPAALTLLLPPPLPPTSKLIQPLPPKKGIIAKSYCIHCTIS